MFLGKSEVVAGAAGLFQQRNASERIFSRNDFTTSSPLSLAQYRPSIEFAATATGKSKAAPPDPKLMLRERLARTYAPPSVLMDTDHKLMELFGDTKAFFQFGEGTADLDVLNIIRTDLRTEVRALIHRAEHTDAGEARGQVFREEDAATDFRIHVQTLCDSLDVHQATLLSFEPAPKKPEPVLPASSTELGDLTEAHTQEQLSELQDELTSTREHLQTVIEELETSNEELHSLNEELQASGEELQTSNEELATSNEELQATNEELSTVNDELQVKTATLSDTLVDLENIQDSTSSALVVVDKDLLVARFNAAAIRMIGLTEGDIGRNLTALPVRLPIPDLYDRLRKALGDEVAEPLEVNSGVNVYRPEIRPYHDRHGDVCGVVLSLSDITSLKHTESALQQVNDLFRILTENENIAVWVQEPHFGRVIYVSPAYRQLYGLDPEMLMRDPEHMFKVMHREDAEGFRRAFVGRHGEPWSMRTRIKEVNDSMGHEAGDQLLAEAAQRIRDGVRASDTVCRFGGDEFVLLLPKYQRSQAPELTARALLSTLEQPFEIKGQSVYVSASIGVAVYPQDGTDGSELLRNADAAMYKAKKSGRRGFAFYQPELNRDAVRRMTLEGELHKAITSDQLRAYYQPIVDIKSNRVTAFEALVRWQHPKRGLLPPAQFVPYAEEVGLIDDITKIMVKEARACSRRWRKDFESELRIAINFCARQLREETFKQLFNDDGADLSCFIIEVTESVLADEVETKITDSLHWLRERGAMIALDDFGTGYSSLSRVRRFPVDIIKINREFVVDSADNKRDAALVKAAVAMARGIEARVVAEGVDSDRFARTMLELDIDTIQGYLYAEPMPAREVNRFMEERAVLLGDRQESAQGE